MGKIIEVHLMIDGHITTLIPLFSLMDVALVEMSGESGNVVHLEGILHVDKDYLMFHTVAEFIQGAIRSGNYFGRYALPELEKGGSSDRAKFASLNGQWTEIEVDKWGSFTFPDPGSLADLEEFAARELRTMREFLIVRDEVSRLMAPVDARYKNTISKLCEHGEQIMRSERFLEVLKMRVQETQTQMLENMIVYGLVEWLIKHLGDDGVEMVLAAAAMSKE